MANDGIGVSVLRKEDRRFTTGQGEYTDDVNLSQQLHAVFVRSPHAHATIKSVDLSAAEKMPGVVALHTGEELEAGEIKHLICGWMIHSKDGSPMKMGPYPPLAIGKVRFVGQPVIAVVAETAGQAQDAAHKVEIDYEIHPAVTRPDDALKPDAPAVHEFESDNAVWEHGQPPKNLIFDWGLGDQAATDKAFADARHVVKIDIVNNRTVPSAMETRAVVADYNSADEHFTLWNTTQNPHLLRVVLSAFVNVAPEHKLRIIAPDVGGGFGSKIFTYSEEVVCLWSARATGRPVKWTSGRSEAFLSDAHGRDHVTTAELAFDENHKMLGLRVDTIANIGAYMSLFASLIPTYLYGPLMSGQYVIPAIHVNVRAVYTNTVPVDAVRGAGRPEATYVVERLVETAARELGVDRAEIRRKNFVRDFPYQTPVLWKYDSGNYDGLLDSVLTASKWSDFPARKAEAAARGKLRGIGLSCYIEACGVAPSSGVGGALGCGVGMWEMAEIKVNPVGTVEVLVGTLGHGQGHETTYAQIAADRFGIPASSVAVIEGDTDKVQQGMGSYGSRSAGNGTAAVSRALDKVEAKAKKIAAHLLEASDDDITIVNGEFIVAGTNKKLTLTEVALAAYTFHKLPRELDPGLDEKAYFDPTDLTYPAGAFVCEVEIDPATGVTQIVQFSAMDDFGNVINPMIVEGQVHGGVIHGLGQALLEEAVYDPESGQLMAGSYNDYCLPRARDLPGVFELGFQATPSPNNPLGLKGCGEAGAIGAPPAIINAITDAIGSNDLQMPATAEKVWRALQKVSAKNAA
ncbi:MAG: xanthine dehydrogenase family protein molybdopterin-binding subunit [Hyphomicrobiales bacterium]|nr:xanthine dehydrogenase family protein molybdopterin-binding subunit [Hyphomicrobiales bacterium]